MALIRKFERKKMNRNSLHEETEATYTVFENDGRTLLQLNSFGTKSRKNTDKKSQTILLDEIGAENLFKILKAEFGFS